MEIKFLVARHNRLSFEGSHKQSIRTVLESKVKDNYLRLSILTTRENPNDNKTTFNSFLEISDNKEAINVHVYCVGEGSLTCLSDHISIHGTIKEMIINQIKSYVLPT